MGLFKGEDILELQLRGEGAEGLGVESGGRAEGVRSKEGILVDDGARLGHSFNRIIRKEAS
jgi:hypothetical protein